MAFGRKLDLVTRQCVVCGRWWALRLDLRDLDLWLNHGLFVQVAFPYLDAGLRELLLSGVGPCC